MKIIIYCVLFSLVACSNEQATFKNSDNVLNDPPISTDLKSKDQTHLDIESASESVDSELKAYFIHAKILSKDQKDDVKRNDGGVVYFHETKENDPKLSLLKYWDNDPDLVIDYEKMTALSKSKNLIFYIQDQVDEIPADQAWMYREDQ